MCAIFDFESSVDHLTTETLFSEQGRRQTTSGSIHGRPRGSVVCPTSPFDKFEDYADGVLMSLSTYVDVGRNGYSVVRSMLIQYVSILCCRSETKIWGYLTFEFGMLNTKSLGSDVTTPRKRIRDDMLCPWPTRPSIVSQIRLACSRA